MAGAILSAPMLLPPPPAQDRAMAGAVLAEGPLRITAFGTSLTGRATWPDVLAATLHACLSREVVVTRVAMAGAGSDWALTQTGRVIGSRPDIVTIEFAINDADLIDGVTLAQSRTRHEQILEALHRGAPGAGILLMTTNPVRGWRGATRPFLAAHYRGYRALAKAADTGLADLWPRWAGTALGGRDGIHPDPAREAQLAVPVLARMIGARFGTDCRA